ncbi:MAG: tetratricopeptide repeat protein, partial [Pseudohongiellaceae bacterium]
MPSAQEQFVQANTALRSGDLGRAQKLLRPLLQDPRLGIDSEHALAVVERKLGNFAAAAGHFVTVLQTRRDDPHVYNNYANCLRDLEQHEEAMANYQQALRLKPDYIDAAVNLAMLQKNLGLINDAEQTLRTGIRNSGEHARLLHGLGSVLREVGRHDEAAILLDKALALSPATTTLLHLRALVEAERGKAALPFYLQAVDSARENPELQLGYAVAQLEAGMGDEAISTLTRLTREKPLWVPGHSALSQLKWQLGYGEDFVTSFESALQTYPSERDLYIGYFATLMRAGRYQTVLDHLDQARSALPDKLLLDRYEAACASEAGDSQRAAAFFSRMPEADDSELEIARIRFLLRIGKYDLAAANAERISRDMNVMGAWPYLSVAWRLIGDPRSEWLDGGGRLFAYFDFPEIIPELKLLAAKLKNIHHAKEHPFDQSMRGGSQTDGNLFLRSDPDLRRMRVVIEQGVS